MWEALAPLRDAVAFLQYDAKPSLTLPDLAQKRWPTLSLSQKNRLATTFHGGPGVPAPVLVALKAMAMEPGSFLADESGSSLDGVAAETGKRLPDVSLSSLPIPDGLAQHPAFSFLVADD